MTSAAQSELSVSLVRAWERAAAAAVLPHVPLEQATGTVLVAGAGDAEFSQEVLARTGQARRILFMDAEADRLDRVRNLDAASVPTFFNHQSSRELNFDDGVFEMALCVRDITTTADAFNALASLSRVVQEGGFVALAGVGPRSLEVLSELLMESVYAADSEALNAAFADHHGRRVLLEELEGAASRFSLETVASGSEVIALTLDGTSAVATDPWAAELVGAWRAVDNGIRATGTSVADALERLKTYFGEQPITEHLELNWIVARVSVAEPIAIDDADVVAEL